ncbi:MAG TPA: J domain-containing protein [Miltoncostaeaceae bacterium]|nr:J domain-containing protein [Miltoncostaeaceae bacterium]
MTDVRDPDDHYAALGVDPGAPREEIREAWRFHLAAFHPDRFRDPSQRARAEEITKAANAAWQVLGDVSRRRRYDLRRERDRDADAVAPQAPPPPPVRELPCPSCATRSRVPDAGGRVVQLACPGCGDSFPAMIGARCVGRPRLEKRWLGLRYQAVFADDEGRLSTVEFRRLPAELALTEGERFSIVFHARRPRPKYAILHGPALDVGWRVR